MSFRVLAGAAAAFLVSVGAAQAAQPATQVFNLGTLSPTFTGVTNRLVDPGQTFTDTVNFSIDASPLSTVLSAVSYGTLFGFQPSTFSATLFNAASSATEGPITLGGGSFNLAPGAYSIVLTGTALANPAQGAVYSLGLAAPVPEPHEWALLLAGLGVVGWSARRARREQVSAPLAA